MRNSSLAVPPLHPKQPRESCLFRGRGAQLDDPIRKHTGDQPCSRRPESRPGRASFRLKTRPSSISSLQAGRTRPEQRRPALGRRLGEFSRRIVGIVSAMPDRFQWIWTSLVAPSMLSRARLGAMVDDAGGAPRRSGSHQTSLLEGSGFEPSVPSERGLGFEPSAVVS